MRKVIQSVCLVILCFATALARSQDYAEWHNGVTERWSVDLNVFSKQALDTATNRWESVKADSQDADPSGWAGGYFVGSDTHGTYLRWSPRSGFVMANVDKCSATLMGLYYGKVVVTPAALEFVFEYQKSSGAHGHSATHRPALKTVKYVPVKWSHDRYLVREGEMAAFGDYAAGLGKYNQEYFWVGGEEFFVRRVGAVESNYEESPQAPPGYERFIRKPVDAEIKMVNAPKLKRMRNSDGGWEHESHTRVSLNVGTLSEWPEFMARKLATRSSLTARRPGIAPLGR